MNILQVGKFYPAKGGVEKVMFDLASGISSKGIRCDVLCTLLEKIAPGKSVERNDFSRLHLAKNIATISSTTISPEMIVRLRGIRDNYDIIHIHHPDPMSALSLWTSGFKGKVVLHWHSDIIKHKSALKCYKPLQDWLIKRADIIVGTSPVYVKESPFLQEVQEKTTYFPIGVDHIENNKEYEEKIRQKYHGKKIILSIGRLVPYKGFQHLIDAAHYLSDDYVILIGGDGPLRSELQQKIDHEQLQDKVKLIGFIPSPLKGAYYNACDVFCLSSMMKTEAFAIVQVEAMSCGKPIVATKIEGSGVPWVNKDGYSGINVQPGDGRLLAEAIVEICEHDHYEQFCKQALQRHKDYFTRPEMIDNCLAIYKSII